MKTDPLLDDDTYPDEFMDDPYLDGIKLPKDAVKIDEGPYRSTIINPPDPKPLINWKSPITQTIVGFPVVLGLAVSGGAVLYVLFLLIAMWGRYCDKVAGATAGFDEIDRFVHGVMWIIVPTILLIIAGLMLYKLFVLFRSTGEFMTRKFIKKPETNSNEEDADHESTISSR